MKDRNVGVSKNDSPHFYVPGQGMAFPCPVQ